MSLSAIKCLGMLVALAWPILVFALHDKLGSWPLLVVGAALLAWRLPQARLLALTGATLLLAVGGLAHAELGMRAYPIAVNAIMLAIFLTSLGGRMPIVERLARLREPELSAAGVRYTRRVTWAWCIFFVVNGGIATWTALYAELSVWALYNGVISYGLIGLMFTSEWLLRQRLRSSLT